MDTDTGCYLCGRHLTAVAATVEGARVGWFLVDGVAIPNEDDGYDLIDLNEVNDPEFVCETCMKAMPALHRRARVIEQRVERAIETATQMHVDDMVLKTSGKITPDEYERRILRRVVKILQGE